MLKKVLKSLFFGVAAIVLVAAGIKAADRGAETLKPDPERCPAGMVFVASAQGGFCIDKYEASAGYGCPVKEPGNLRDSIENLNYSACQAVSQSGASPWRFVTRDQAEQACARAQKRLATNEEWQQAALGTPDKAEKWNEQDCQVDGNWRSQPGKTGSGANCISAVGAYDMVGNVWEWTKGTVLDGKLEGRQLPAKGYVKIMGDDGLPLETAETEGEFGLFSDYLWLKQSGPRGIARGGYWGNESEAGQYAAYIVAPPDSAETGIGFRCVGSPNF